MAKFNATFIDSENLKASFTNSEDLNAVFGVSQVVETGNYNALSNKPQINNITLVGNKTGEELKLQDLMQEITPQEIDGIIFG